MIFTQHVPVCTDLLTIGAGSVIPRTRTSAATAPGPGLIETGSVTLGAGSFIGEHSVIDINTALGDGAQLGHASALLSGQAVPAGECWHGSPAEPPAPDDDYRTVAPARCGALRRAWYSLTPAAAAAGRGRPRWRPRSRACCCPGPRWPSAARPAAHRHGRPGHPAAFRAVQPGPGGPRAGTGPGRITNWISTRRCWSSPRPCSSASSWPGWSSSAPAGRLLSRAAASRGGSTPCTASTTRCSARLPDDEHRRSSTPCSGTARPMVAVPGLHRLPAEAGGADRLELRHGGQARHADAQRRGHRHDGLRRPVHDQRRVLQPARSASRPSSSGPATSWATASPIRRAAGPATTACWPPRS